MTTTTSARALALALAFALAASPAIAASGFYKCTIHGSLQYQQTPCPPSEVGTHPTAQELNAERRNKPLPPATARASSPATSPAHDSSAGEPAALQAAINEKKNGAPVTGEGLVTKLLPDDTTGKRHQRFILSLASGKTLLIAHNIDLAPRLAALKLGDTVAFNGVYEWNPKGGVIHWTHHDPRGSHPAGWLKHAGQTYQ